MDLSTCQSNLEKGEYKFVEECLNDIQLIWDNCKYYNAMGSEIYNEADQLSKVFQALITEKHFKP